jgi:hypothetical protein
VRAARRGRELLVADAVRNWPLASRPRWQSVCRVKLRVPIAWS